MTDTATVTLAEFLLARIEEDEEIARDSGGDEWTGEGNSITRGHPTDEVVDWVYDYGGPSTASHIARWDPARVLAECEAKRRIVKDLVPEIRANDDAVNGEWDVSEDCAGDLLKLLALPYAGHPDYRQEWRS